MNHKSFRGHATVKSAAEGIAEIVISAYNNVDHDGDVVLKGACAKQIAGEYGPNPKGLLDHEWKMRSAVAKTLRWWEEDDGTHVEAQYNLEKEAGRDAFSDLKFYGDDMEFSVGYDVKKTVPPDDGQKSMGARRVISEWMIAEWSHVMLGANSNTHLVSAKSGSENFAVGGVINATANGVLTTFTTTTPDMAVIDRAIAERFKAYEEAFKGAPSLAELRALEAVELEPVPAPEVFLDPMRVAKFRHLVATNRLT